MEDLKISIIEAYYNHSRHGVKAVEAAIQEEIENIFPDKCWWQVCKVSIFELLISGARPGEIANKIVDSIKEAGK